MDKLKQVVTGCLVAISLVLLVACGDQPEPTATPESLEDAVSQAVPQASFIGTSWQVESVGQAEDGIAPIEGTHATLSFGVERYSGSGGCNYFLGVYDTNYDTLRLGTPAQTNLTCESPEGLMKQEASYLQALANVVEYREEDGKLLAYTVDDQLLLTFVPAEPVPVEGTAWLLKFQVLEGGPAPVSPGTEITALLEDGTISGSSGCNTYQGSYELNDDNLVIGDLAVTERVCEDPVGIMDQEAAYISTLSTVASLSQSGTTLELMDADGRLILLYGAP